MLAAPFSRYLEKRTVPGPWRLEGCARPDFDAAVVIPALAEAAFLPATLASLALNPPDLLERFLVVIVVNHRAEADSAEVEDNHRLLAWLRAGGHSSALRLAWVDAASAGRELPPGEGVGLARKLGCDLALARLAWGGAAEPLLVMLDADTLVDGDYLPAIAAHFRRVKAGGAVLPFAHQSGATAELDAAIERYELYMRGYVLGLVLAGSPYAYHAVGSTIACRAAAYLQAGGMNRRQAGEDFYFLQQLAKTSGVAALTGTLVRPAARLSRRVPFGTGASLHKQLAGGAHVIQCHPAAAFDRLGAWLAMGTAAGPDLPGVELLRRAGAIDPALGVFLHELGLPAIWDRLRQTHRHPAALRRAFHGWFDALRSRQLLHRLAGGSCPLEPPETALPPLLARAGLPGTGEIGKQLAMLRFLQNGPSAGSAD